MERRAGPGRPRMYLCYFLGTIYSLLFGARGRFFGLSLLVGPAYDRQGRSGAMEQVICKTATADCFGSGGAAAMALRAACSGIEIQDCTHTAHKRTTLTLFAGIPWARTTVWLGALGSRALERGSVQALRHSCGIRGSQLGAWHQHPYTIIPQLPSFLTHRYLNTSTHPLLQHSASCLESA